MSIGLQAHPDYYDYIHYLFLNDDNTVKFVDGGGQVINGTWYGTWSMNDDTLTLEYDKEEIYINKNYETVPLENKIVITCKVIKKKEYTLFYDGYSYMLIDTVWVFDKSPCPSTENQGHNLFNILENVSTPLSFYTNVVDKFTFNIPHGLYQCSSWILDESQISKESIKLYLQNHIREHPPKLSSDFMEELNNYNISICDGQLDVSKVDMTQPDIDMVDIQYEFDKYKKYCERYNKYISQLPTDSEDPDNEIVFTPTDDE